MKNMKLSTLLIGLVLATVAHSQTPITISALRTLGAPSITAPYFVTDAGCQGVFYYDPVDLNTLDNNGTVIVNGVKRYKRVYTDGTIDARWFGMKGDYNGTTGSDNATALRAAINAAKTGEKIVIPNGQYLFNSTITLPLTTTKKVVLEIFGDLYFNKVSGFIIEGANQEFRSYGLIVGMNSGGVDEASFAKYIGTAIYLKNTLNCYIQVNEIKDFKYGIHMAGDKNGGYPAGCQYNNIHFNSIHHNHTQIRISTTGATDLKGNWNNSSFFYGGQLGRGIPSVTYGKGGTYGVVFSKDPTSNQQDPMNGHSFVSVAFEGLDKGIVANNANYNAFIGGRIEPFNVRLGIDLDPVTCIGNKFVGFTTLEEDKIVPGRLGSNTVFSATPIWTGSTLANKVLAGTEAVTSITPNKLLITGAKWGHTSYVLNTANDLITQTGQFPTVQAMMYRINGVSRSVPYKGTFLQVKTSTAGSPITLPPNISRLRVEANQAKVFKIDAGDLAAYGEEFIVEYLTPAYPISFIRSDNSAVVIPTTAFPSGGIYRCLWADGQYKVSRIGTEFKAYTQTGGTYVIGDGIETHYVNWQYGNATSTLPPAASYPGRTITIKNLQASKTVSVVGVNASDESIIQGRGAMTVRSDGTSWNIISFYKRSLTF
jgi:hypothetical protein